MNQAELERELARTTGESLSTIRGRGFSLIEMPDREPQSIDWDQVYPSERSRAPLLRRPRRLRQTA